MNAKGIHILAMSRRESLSHIGRLKATETELRDDLTRNRESQALLVSQIGEVEAAILALGGTIETESED